MFVYLLNLCVCAVHDMQESLWTGQEYALDLLSLPNRLARFVT